MNFPYIAKKKVLQLGKGSLAVLLPAVWIRENNIEKGTEVIVFANGEVVIRAATPDQIQRAGLAVKKLMEDPT